MRKECQKVAGLLPNSTCALLPGTSCLWILCRDGGTKPKFAGAKKEDERGGDGQTERQTDRGESSSSSVSQYPRGVEG